MNIVNSIISALFGILFLPFQGLAPVWGMLAVSFITGILMLLVFKATSDQKGIKRAKNLVKGHFLATRLYKDDISVMFETIGNIIKSNLAYMQKSLRPMLVMMLPVGAVLIQLGVRYEFRPLQINETSVVSLSVDDASVKLQDVTLELPEGVTLDMPPVRIEPLREISWRIRAKKQGRYKLIFRYEKNIIEKELQVSESLIPLAAAISSNDIGTAVMNPSEKSIPEHTFASMVSIAYPQREFQAFGFSGHWLVAFFVFSLVAAFGFKGFFGVEV